MDELINLILSILWFVNLVYAFVFWGGEHGFYNLFVPYAMIADLLRKIGRI